MQCLLTISDKLIMVQSRRNPK